MESHLIFVGESSSIDESLIPSSSHEDVDKDFESVEVDNFEG